MHTELYFLYIIKPHKKIYRANKTVFCMMYYVRLLASKRNIAQYVAAEHLNISDLSENFGNQDYGFLREHFFGELMTFRKAKKNRP